MLLPIKAEASGFFFPSMPLDKMGQSS